MRAESVSNGLITIGELARLTGVGISTLRTWGDRYGLLFPARSRGGFRLYSPDDVNRVLALKKALLVDRIPPSLLDGQRLSPAEAGGVARATKPVVPDEPPVPASEGRDTGAWLRRLYQASTALACTLDVDRAGSAVVAAACAVSDADAAVLLTVDGDGSAGRPRSVKTVFGAVSPLPTPLDGELLRLVEESRTILPVPDVASLMPDGLPGAEGTGSLLAAPIVYDGRFRGVVYTVSLARRPYTAEDVLLAATFAGLAASCLEVAHQRALIAESGARLQALAEADSERRRLAAELERRNERISVMNSLASALSETLDIDDVLRRAANAVVRSTGMETAIVSLLDENSGELVFRAHCNAPQALVEDVKHIKLGEGISGRVALTGEPMLVRSIADDPRSTTVVPYARRHKNRSFVCVPLKSKTGVVGTMMITARRFQPISDDDVQLFSAIGNLIGGAVERARIHERSVKSYSDRLVLMRDELRLMAHVRAQERIRIAGEIRRYILDPLDAASDAAAVDIPLSALRSLEKEIASPTEGASLPLLLEAALPWREAYDPDGRQLRLEVASWPDNVPHEITGQLYLLVMRLLVRTRDADPSSGLSVALLHDDASITVRVEVRPTRAEPGVAAGGPLDWDSLDLVDIHRMVNSLGGRVRTAACPTSTALSVTIPRYWDQALAEKRIAALIVNDQPLYGQALAGLLDGTESVQVVGVVQSTQEAVQAVRRLSPDVVIVDVEPPAMRGIDATRAIRGAAPTQRILILTPDQGQSVVEGLLAGATGFIQKTASPLDLLRAIGALLTTESTLTQAVAERALALLAPPGSPRGAEAGTQRLTPRETEILRLIAGGKSSKECCRILRINDKTLRTHISNMYQKLQIFDRAQLVLYAARKGLVDIASSHPAELPDT